MSLLSRLRRIFGRREPSSSPQPPPWGYPYQAPPPSYPYSPNQWGYPDPSQQWGYPYQPYQPYQPYHQVSPPYGPTTWRWRPGWQVRSYMPDPAKLPYRLVTGLLSPAEHTFYRVLLNVIRPTDILIPKVRLADLAEVDRRLHASGTRGEHHWFRRIAPMHVDFVLCERETLRPLTAIELDDMTHRTNPRQQQADAWKARVLAQIGLPLVRVPYQQGYSPRDLTAAIYPSA